MLLLGILVVSACLCGRLELCLLSIAQLPGTVVPGFQILVLFSAGWFFTTTRSLFLFFYLFVAWNHVPDPFHFLGLYAMEPGAFPVDLKKEFESRVTKTLSEL